MGNVNIKEVNGGEVTTLNSEDGVEIDTGLMSVWIKISNFAAEIFKRLKYNTSNITVTTDNISASENTFYNLTIAGITANRNFILPAPSAAGVEITVNIADGDDTYFIILIGAASVTINSGSAATEFHRIRTKDMCITFRSTSTTNWQVISGLCEVVLPMVAYDSDTSPYTTSGYKLISPIARAMSLQRVEVSYYGNATINGTTNYWAVDIYDTGGGTIGTGFNAQTQATWAQQNITSFSTKNVTSTNVFASIYLTKVQTSGTTGSIYLYANLVAWLS